MMFRTFIHTVGTPRAFLSFFILFPVVLLFLFLFIQRTFIGNIIAGDFPLWLFSRILPSLAYDFFFGDIALAMHYLFIAFLVSLYLFLIAHILRRKYVSLLSLGTSLAGLAGITLGISCISCGAFAGLLLASSFGVLSLPFTLAHTSTLFLIVGELLLVFSIVSALIAIRRFEQ